MKKFLAFVFWFLFLAGCAHFDLAAPRNEREALPVRNQDSRWGIITNEGTTHLELWLKDEAGRIVEHDYMAGANRFLAINDQNIPEYWVRQLEFGNYLLEYIPFYYETNIVGPIFGQPFRYRVDLPKQTTCIYVGRNPTAYYDYRTGRHWGWICSLNGGQIPATTGIPGVKINLQGNFRR
jgi:hypothetical protein